MPYIHQIKFVCPFIAFHHSSTSKACNHGDFCLVLKIVFYIKRLSYSLNLCLDKYGSMIINESTTFRILLISYCNFSMDLLQVAWVLSFFQVSSSRWCIMTRIFSLSLNVSFSCTYTYPCKLSLSHYKATDWISKSFAYFFTT